MASYLNQNNPTGADLTLIPTFSFGKQSPKKIEGTQLFCSVLNQFASFSSPSVIRPGAQALISHNNPLVLTTTKNAFRWLTTRQCCLRSGIAVLAILLIKSQSPP
ncbi:hypothetical protein CW304_02910 [Bacillus sp. UFRGS-B20]|nr:hypothetical protein CW304_02910 [Bacillus sp. UFRGS-B20]